MSEWFPPLDDALGGIADAAENTVEGAASTAGDAAGGLLGGIYGGLGNWLLKMAFLSLAAFAVVKVVA